MLLTYVPRYVSANAKSCRGIEKWNAERNEEDADVEVNECE